MADTHDILQRTGYIVIAVNRTHRTLISAVAAINTVVRDDHSLQAEAQQDAARAAAATILLGFVFASCPRSSPVRQRAGQNRSVYFLAATG